MLIESGWFTPKRWTKFTVFCYKLFKKNKSKYSLLTSDGLMDWTVNDEEEELQLSAAESFRVNYFLVVVDAAIASLDSRFEQLKEFERCLVSYTTQKI
jgi:hypothetical protein